MIATEDKIKTISMQIQQEKSISQVLWMQISNQKISIDIYQE